MMEQRLKIQFIPYRKCTASLYKDQLILFSEIIAAYFDNN
jgi:hypothetical protein